MTSNSTVFIATINEDQIFRHNVCCSLKAKSFLEVPKIFKGSLLFDFQCGYHRSFRAYYKASWHIFDKKQNKTGFCSNIIICQKL